VAPTAAAPPPGLPPLPPPANTDSLSIVAALRELVAARETPTTAGKDYYRHELEKLFPVIGAERPFHGLTEASLPLFWLDFKTYRKSASRSRSFMESFRDQYYPTNRPRFAFLLSPQLIKDVQNLNLPVEMIS
jgi:hypothetical protein